MSPRSRSYSHTRRIIPIALFIALISIALTSVSAAIAPTPNSVKIVGDTLQVDGANFPVRGVAYSPVPVGEDVNFAPYGDYFTPDYAYIWVRDLKNIKATGFNTIRIYSWATGINHAPFLDTCHQMGLKVIITHFLGTSSSTPVSTASDRQASVDAFVKHVTMYGDHPAILMWAIGNEINGAWNGFKTSFSDAFNCKWTQSCEANVEGSDSQCFKAASCMYPELFKWLNSLAAGGKQVTTRPMTTAFADVDQLIGTNPAIDRIPRFEQFLPDLDLHMMQLYRGRSFGEYFGQFAAESKKPLLVGEYGVDAYNDECGWPENFQTMRPCFNLPVTKAGQNGGSVAIDGKFIGCTGTGADCADPGAVTQASWDRDLTEELEKSPVALGGIIVSYVDEYWKSIGVQDFCRTPCKPDDIAQCSNSGSDVGKRYQMGGQAECTYKAHVTCSNYNTSFQDLCGYFLASAPDRYVNEAWFGLNAVKDCGVSTQAGHRLSALTPRPILQSLADLWGATGGVKPQTCEELLPCWQCTRQQSAANIVIGACDTACGLQFGTLNGGTPTEGGNTGGNTGGTTGGDVPPPYPGTIIGSSNGNAGAIVTPTISLVLLTIGALVVLGKF